MLGSLAATFGSDRWAYAGGAVVGSALWLLALLPGLGNFAGGMLAEFRGASPRMLNLALHAASGIVIGCGIRGYEFAIRRLVEVVG